jgi:D-3-phosphoglycerate dehydrogenase
VDLDAARAAGIPVCNVPDYCVDEVADHALALALSLARQLPQIDARTRKGVWTMKPVTPMPAFRDMLFATAGFGRIARAALDRARPFGFRLGAYDPFVPEAMMHEAGVQPLSVDRLFAEADVLSLHMPLTAETNHFVSSERLEQMKRSAILINTSRGALVDTRALAAALTDDTIGYAGIDVFESEPLPEDHPIRSCENALLTSHVAWYSERSVPQLQRLAAEEVVRRLRGEPLKNQVNR